ncbi:MAG: metallophosphoesterase family protein [Pirellulales bacterium]
MPITVPPLSRRKFVTGSLSLAGAAALSSSLTAKQPKTEVLLDKDRVALLADTHISANPKQFYYGTQWPGTPVKEGEHEGVNMADCLATVVKDVLSQNPLPAHAVVNGDCALSNGKAEEYQEFIRLIKPLRQAGITVHVTIGNHDNRQKLWNAIPEFKSEELGRQVGVVELPKTNFVLLDSDRGTMGEEQFQWLDKTLGTLGDKPVIGFGHYHPYPHHGVRPSRGQRDGASLLPVLKRHKNLKAYCYGHTHNWVVEQKSDIHFINQLPVSYYFAKGLPHGWVDMKLSDTGAEIEMRCVDPEHSQHKEQHSLVWREG